MRRLMSLVLAIALLFSTIPTQLFAMNNKGSEGLQGKYLEERYINGKRYFVMPVDSVELVKDNNKMSTKSSKSGRLQDMITPYAITPNVPTKDGAGQLINAAASIIWQTGEWEFPEEGIKALLILSNAGDRTGKEIATAQVTKPIIKPGLPSVDDLKANNFQYITTKDYKAGDEKGDLYIALEVRYGQNIRVRGGTSNKVLPDGKCYYFSVEQKAILVYTSEWYDNNKETRPTVKGWLKAPKGTTTEVELPKENKVYRNAGSDANGYIDELDLEGNEIKFIRQFDSVGKFTNADLNLGMGQTLKSAGKFLSYDGVEAGKPTKTEVKTLGNKGGKIPAFSKKALDEDLGKLVTTDYPAYFYYLVGDNNHMWRFQMREVLQVKLNSGAGKVGTEANKDLKVGGEEFQEIGHSEMIKDNVSGREISFNTDETIVAPKVQVGNSKVDATFAGWATKPQTLTDGKLSAIEGKLVEVNGDLTNEGKTFTFKSEKPTTLYAVFQGPEEGAANVKYVYVKDENATDLSAKYATIPGSNDGKITGSTKDNVSLTYDEHNKAPEFEGYKFTGNTVVDPANAKYVKDEAGAKLPTVYVVYEAEKIADKYDGKLDPKDIKVWVEDDIDWKKGVKVKGVAEDSDENKALKAELDKANAKVEDLGENGTVAQKGTLRNSDAQNLPDGKKGNLLVTFNDGSTLVVNDQTLYVADKKVEVKPQDDPKYIDPEKLPDDKVKVEIKLGEGVKEAKQGGKVGNAANPVVIKTYYVKPGTGLAADDFPTTTGKNAEIVKQANYKNTITWNPSELTQNWSKDGAYVASAEIAVCKDKDVVKAEFEQVIDPMFENIKKKDGVYLGKYDKENKKVTVAIMNKTQGAKQLTGTGLATGLENLYKNNNLIKIKVGTQDERDLRDLAKSQPSSGMTLQQLFATVFGADVINEVQKTGDKTGKLADFIGKSVTLKLTVQEPDCEGNAVELTYTIEGKEAVSSILKGKLTPQDIKVWKGDTIDWEKGVAKDETGLTAGQIKQIKDEFSTYENGVKKTIGKAKFEDATTPVRNSEAVSANPFVGNIKVTFSDGSELLVQNQNLYVSDHVTGSKNENAPEDAIEVQFLLGNGVKAKKGSTDIVGAETPVLYETYKVKPDLNLDDYKLGTGKTIFDSINPESTNTDKFKGIVWTPTDHVVTKTNNRFTATATESFIMKHEFKLLDKDNNNAEIAVLPEVLTKKLPADKTIAKGTTYTPAKLEAIKEVKEADNNFYDYTFVKWEPAEAKDEDKTFIGTWTREQSTSKKPIINPVKPEDKNITGKGVPGSEIEVTIPGVKDPIKTTVEQNGDWTVKVPEDKKLKTGEEIVVTQKELGKKPNSDNTKVGEEPKPEPQPEPMPTPEYNPWWPMWFGSTKTEVKKEEPKHLERHEEYIAGYPDGTVRPDGKITRAEVSAIFARLTENSAPANYSTKFSDVLAYDWFCDSVMKLSNKDIIKGYPDGTFKPNKSITRAEFAVIASKYIKNPKAADETFSDVPMNHWAKDAIAMVKAEGWISGYTDGTFKPDAPITRAEAVSIVNRMFDRAADGEFVREHGFEIKKFNDLTDKHWAYYDIMEAVHTHDYERIDKRTERWDKIVK